MNRSVLKLAWSNNQMAETDRKKDKKQKQSVSNQGTSQTASVPFFQNRAQMVLVFLATLGGLGLIGGVAFFFGALNLKTEFGERIGRVEGRLDVIEAFARKQLVARAQELLGSNDVQVAYVNQTSSELVHITPKPPRLPIDGSKGPKRVIVTYTLEAIMKDSIIIRVRAILESEGKIEKTLSDRQIQAKFPSPEEKRVFYDLTLRGDKGFSTPPVRIEIVIVEQLGPDRFVVAVGMRPTPEKEPA